MRNLRVSVGHPLDRQGWPCERMGVERVVEEGGMLLPYFVLLEYALFFELVSVVNYRREVCFRRNNLSESLPASSNYILNIKL